MILNKHFFFGLLLLIALGFSTWVYTHQQFRREVIKKNYDHLPDFIIDDVSAAYFTKAGTLDKQYMSPHLMHYPKSDHSVFTKPVIILYEENAAPWHITSNDGTADNGINTLNLMGNVRIAQAASENHQSTTLLTETLLVKPQEEYAETDKPVTLLQPGTKIKSIGMRISLEKGHVELLSKAQAFYDNVNPEIPGP